MVIAFLGLYHINSVEIPAIISITQCLANHPEQFIERVTLSILGNVIWKECHVREHGLMQS